MTNTNITQDGTQTIQTQGSFRFPQVQSGTSASAKEELDQAVQTLQEHKDKWAALPVQERITLIDELIRDFYAVMPRLVEAEIAAKGYAGDAFASYVEWSSQLGVLRNLSSLRRALVGIQDHGVPSIPGPISTRLDGQVTAQVFPETSYDRLFFNGYTAEVWMEPGVTVDSLSQTQALTNQPKDSAGSVALVLCAGNFSSLGAGDVLHKLFVENQVVIIKMNPVNAYAGPFIAEGFRALVKAGFMVVVYGGAVEGAYLCNHVGVDEIHITGSDKTFEAIVFGPGSEGASNKAQRRPILTKRVTGELGNVTPVIIVPGVWRASEIDLQAEKLVTWMVTGTGFVCHSPHALILHAEWPQRQQFLNAFRRILSSVPLHKAYYPGAKARQQAFVAAHPDAEMFGQPVEDEIPWTLIPAVSIENKNDICFTTEPFCGLISEIPIQAADTAEFISRAVDFANNSLWGTLNASLFVSPTSLKDPAIATAFEAGIASLRYGTICVNHSAGIPWYFSVVPWGGISGQDIFDVQSGIGFVHNTLMFSRAQKTVVRTPFAEKPKPISLISNGPKALKVMPKFAALEAQPSPWKIPVIMAIVLGL